MNYRRGIPRAHLVLCQLLALAGASACKPQTSAETGVLRIAVVPKGSSHTFWKSIHAGADSAAAALTRDLSSGKLARKAAGKVPLTAVEIIWKGPLREDDREQQVQVVEGFTAQAVDGIVLAPLDARALSRPVEEAQRLYIPTVVVDSDLHSPAIVSFVATDNHRGGSLCAERLATLLGGKGKVIMLRYQQGSASTEAREAGFLEKIAQFPGIEVISSDQHAGSSRDTAKRAAENLLNRFGDEVQGIFASNESATMGTLLALQDIGQAGKILLVGFDSSPPLIEALQARQLQGLVVQDPFAMGDQGVRAMVDHILGRQVRARVETDAVLVTSDNLNEPRIQHLVKPVGGAT